jgi:group I intron endonuclease
MKGQFIYKIINTTNGKFYVGSTTNTRERFRTHRNKLRGNKHHCPHLQAAWNKYGENAFLFRVVEDIPQDQSLQEAEDRWLIGWVGNPQCYNAGLRSGAPWRGVKTEDHPCYGREKSDEEKARISAGLKATYAADPSAHPRVGKEHTDEVKEQIRQKKLANPTRAWLGIPRDEATKAKISAAQKGRPNPRKGQKMSEQGRLNVAAAVKRGEDSHFYGKRPVNAEALQREIYAVKPDGTKETFPSLTYMRDNLGVSIATVINACKSGKRIKKGTLSGWVVSYTPVDSLPVQEVEIPQEFAHLPRTRELAKAQGARTYFTGLLCGKGHLSPRAVKGECIACRKENEAAARAKKRLAAPH